MVKKKNRWKIFLAPDLSYQSMTRLFFCWVWNSGGKELIQVFTESKSDMESYLICFMSMCQRIKKKKSSSNIPEDKGKIHTYIHKFWYYIF